MKEKKKPIILTVLTVLSIIVLFLITFLTIIKNKLNPHDLYKLVENNSNIILQTQSGESITFDKLYSSVLSFSLLNTINIIILFMIIPFTIISFLTYRSIKKGRCKTTVQKIILCLYIAYLIGFMLSFFTGNKMAEFNINAGEVLNKYYTNKKVKIPLMIPVEASNKYKEVTYIEMSPVENVFDYILIDKTMYQITPEAENNDKEHIKFYLREIEPEIK